jgi:ribonuclease HII
MPDLLKFEHALNDQGITLIAGVDEVGRGPLVGPVVTAAVILPKGFYLEGLTDSKKLSAKKREMFFPIIIKNAISIGIGVINADKIDEVNIYEATKLAMYQAIKRLNPQPEHVLIDAMKLNLTMPSTSIIRGDALSETIGAASVVAKVTRDHMMDALDKMYPEYGFKKHKGYPTKEHLANLHKYGPLPNYRFTFGPVRDLINKESQEVTNEISNK